jgi:MFS family permease
MSAASPSAPGSPSSPGSPSADDGAANQESPGPGRPPDPPNTSLRLFRLYSSLVFSFAWVPVMYTAFTRDRGFSTEQYLKLWSVYYLAMVVAEVPWGWLADRLGHKPLLVAGPAVLAVAFASLGHGETFQTCVFAMALTGAAHAMVSGADSAYLYEMVVAAGRRQDALLEEALAHRWRLFGVSFADLAGGFVAWSMGTLATFDLSVIFMLAAALVAVRLPSVPGRVASIGWNSLAAASRQLFRRDVAWVVVWYATAFVLLRLGFQLYQPTLLAVGAQDPRLYGGLLSLLNLVAGLAAFWVLRVHTALGERGTTLLVLLLLTASFLGLAATPLLLLAPLLCLQQVSFGFLQPIGRTALNHRVSSSERASLLSMQSLLARLAFGSVLALSATSGWDEQPEEQLPPIYLTLAGVGLAAGLALSMAYRRSRRRHAPDPSTGNDD